MSAHQDAIAAAMSRRVQDSALRAAHLNAQYQEERQNTADLQAEYSDYMNGLRNLAVTIIDSGEDG